MWPLLPSGRYTGGFFWEPWGMMLRAGLSVNQVAPDLLALGLSVLACDVESRDTRTKPIQPNQRGPWKDYPACDAQPLRAAWLPALHKVTWWTFPLKERGRQLKIQRSLFASVLSKRLAEARSQGFSPGLPLFGLSPLPPRKHVSRKLEPGAKGGRSTQHTDMGCWCVNCWAACLSSFSFGSENLPYTFYIFLFLACSLRNVNDSMAISIFFSEKQDEM